MSTAWTQKTVSLVCSALAKHIYVKMLKNAVTYIRCWILSKLMHFISHKLGHYALICYHQIFLKVLFDNILTRSLIAVLFSTTDLIIKGGVYSDTQQILVILNLLHTDSLWSYISITPSHPCTNLHYITIHRTCIHIVFKSHYHK